MEMALFATNSAKQPHPHCHMVFSLQTSANLNRQAKVGIGAVIVAVTSVLLKTWNASIFHGQKAIKDSIIHLLNEEATQSSGRTISPFWNPTLGSLLHCLNLSKPRQRSWLIWVSPSSVSVFSLLCVVFSVTGFFGRALELLCSGVF